jgi:broad specificity phosphatase PhoE
MALMILVRHGQTDDNLSGKISGQGAAPLNARGREQAAAVADVLTCLGVSRILSSPLLRSRQTADILAQRLHLDLEERHDLREVEYGDWEGKHFRDVRTHPMAQKVMQNPSEVVFPNGESLLQVVSHGDVIRTALAHYLNMPFNEYTKFNLDNGSLSVLELFHDWVRVKAVNFVPQVGKLWLESFYPTWKQIQQLVTP